MHFKAFESKYRPFSHESQKLVLSMKYFPCLHKVQLFADPAHFSQLSWHLWQAFSTSRKYPSEQYPQLIFATCTKKSLLQLVQLFVKKLQVQQLWSQLVQLASRFVSCLSMQLVVQLLLEAAKVNPSLQDWQFEAAPEHVWHSGLHFLQLVPDTNNPSPHGRHLSPGCR